MLLSDAESELSSSWGAMVGILTEGLVVEIERIR
jgi:hypothetical protein